MMKRILIMLSLISILGTGGIGLYLQHQHSKAITHIIQGDQHYQEGNYREALAAYQQAYAIKTLPEAQERIQLVQETLSAQAKLPENPAETEAVETERKKESIVAKKTPAAGQEWRDPVSGGDSDSDNNSSSLTQELLSVQPDLLAQQKNGLLQERPGIIDLYFVGFAASASLDVFMKEVIYAQQLFNDRFDTKGRSAILVNNTQTIDTLPIASPFNLDEVLKYIGNTINQEEDMVFLFLTGYGTKENSLVVDFDPYLLRDLKPADLKQILQNSGIKWKVIVISACFSGGFIAPLEDSHTLIMTASNPEQRSFGCSHEAEFTYFGKAFFKHQLNLERASFIKAFQEAKIQIYQWEEKWNVEHSDPQISFPDPITKKLEAFELQLTLQTE